MSKFIPNRRGEDFKPRIVSSDPSNGRRELAASVLPKNATLAARGFGPRQAAGFFGGNMPMGVTPVGGGGGGSAAYHMQRPYLPGVESPDRIQFPKSRIEANRAWRLFHETDPIFGTAIDMYAEMLVSDFDLVVGDEKSREIKDTLEYMCQTTQLIDRLKYIVREYLTIGECVPHCFFDDTLGIWTYIAMHNPDYIDIVDTPIVNMDPIINFVPDEDLRRLMSDGSPESREFRSRLPAEFVSKIMARQKIRLSPLNCSFIARKLHPYQVRGTSMASRLWRIFMVEDAVYASTIATFRRAAAPVKVLKLGDPATGWIPAPGSETKLLEMLNRAETDPQCFVPATLITRADGTQTPIGELELGDRLLDKDGKPCEVLALEREETSQLVEIDVAGTPLIECTPNHKWPVWGGPRTCSCGCGELLTTSGSNFINRHGKTPGGNKYQEKKKGQPRRFNFLENFDPYMKLKATEIRPGDYLMIPRKFEEKNPHDISLEQARLLGYYVAEGCVFNSYVRKDASVCYGMQLAFSDEEENTLAEDSCYIIEMLTGVKPTLQRRPTSCNVMVRRKDLSEFCEWFAAHGGKYAAQKMLSPDVMAWPLDLKYEFLKGYLAGDGCVLLGGNGCRISVKSASRDLLNQLRLILAQFGAYGLFYEYKRDAGCYKPGDTAYMMNIQGPFAVKLAKDLVPDAVIPDYKFEVSESSWWSDDEHLYVKVRGIKTAECEDPRTVINMTVSGDHSYLTNCVSTRNSWLIYHYGVNFESWGNQDRAISISKEHDVIERVKLLGLGLSKAFMTGESTYASSKSGLQVFLRRLLSLRQHLESVWLYPKFFRPISEINEWTTSSPSEVNHKYRIKRTAQEIQEQNLILMPTIKWKNKLDPSVDLDILNAYKMLEQGFGLKLSKATVATPVGIDWQDELDKSLKEFKTEEEMKEKTLGKAQLAEYEQKNAPPQATPPGAPGSGAKPPGAAAKPPGAGGAGGLQLGGGGGGMNDASRPPGSADGGGAMGDSIEAPSGGGLPTGVV